MIYVHVTSTCKTWLKKRPEKVSELKAEEKAKVYSSRTIRRCGVIARKNNHTHLATPLGDWWVFDQHWSGLDSNPVSQPYETQSDLIYLKNFPYFFCDSLNLENKLKSQCYALAMCLKYSKVEGINDVMDYIKLVSNYGKVNSRRAHRAVLKDLGTSVKFTLSADPEDIKSQIKSGNPVAASIVSGGPISSPVGRTHFVAISGFNESSWQVQDPFGLLELNTGQWLDQREGSGNNILYDFELFNRRFCVSGGSNGWCWVNFRKK